MDNVKLTEETVPAAGASAAAPVQPDRRGLMAGNLQRRRIIHVAEAVILLLVCALIFFIGLLLFVFCNSKSGIVFMSIGILGFTCISVLSVMQYLRRTWLQLLVFCAIFVLGSLANFYGNSSVKTGQETDRPSCEVKSSNRIDGPIRRLIVSYCSAVSEFFPSRGSYDALGVEEDFNWMTVIFFFLSIAFSVSIVIAIWGSKLTNRWHLFLSRSFFKRSVFWCSIPGAKELILADDIYKSSATEQCIFAVEEFNVGNAYVLQSDLNYKGHLLCMRKPGQFHRVCLSADNHFFLTEDYDWNINTAQELWEKIRVQKKNRCVHFYIRVPDDERDVWAEYWAEEIQKISGSSSATPNGGVRIDIHLISEASLIARMLVERYPLLDSPGVNIEPHSGRINGEFRVLLLGFGEIGKAILRETVCDGQFLRYDNGPEADGKDRKALFSVDIVDNRKESFSYYEAYLGEAVKSYHLSFLEYDVLSGDFYRMIESKLSTYNRIIIAFKNDSLNLEIAARIREIAKRQDIRFGRSSQSNARLLMRISSKTPAMDLAAKSSDSAHAWLSQVDFFGMTDACYGRDIIIDEALDSKAKRINRIYDSQASDESWQCMSMFERESNRSCASGLRNILRLMGVEEKDFSEDAWTQQVKDSLLETLAETEHLRWCAFHFMRGIRSWPVREITDDDATSLRKPNDIKAHMRHAALTEYNDLPEVDRRFGRNSNCLQQNNRMVILSLGKVIKA